jgi:hypothetical protein
MTEIIIVGITMGLIIIVSALYQGRRRRVNLLRVTCAALFVATVCRGVEPPLDGPAVDLLKRLAILTAQVSVALLILTFRATPLSRRATRFIYLFAGIIALGEAVLVWFIPVHADGTIYDRVDIDAALARGQAWALISYNFLYLSAFAAAHDAEEPTLLRPPSGCIRLYGGHRICPVHRLITPGPLWQSGRRRN